MDEEVRIAVESELRLLLPEVRGTAELVDGLLDPEFVEVGSSGRRPRSPASGWPTTSCM